MEQSEDRENGYVQEIAEKSSSIPFAIFWYIDCVSK